MRESATVNNFLSGKRRVATYGPHNKILLVKLAFASDELLINALLREKSPLRRTFFLLFSLSFDSTVAKYASHFRSARSHACYDRGYDNENSYTSQMPMRESATVNSFLCGKRRVATYGKNNQILLRELLVSCSYRAKKSASADFFLLFSLSFVDMK